MTRPRRRGPREGQVHVTINNKSGGSGCFWWFIILFILIPVAALLLTMAATRHAAETTGTDNVELTEPHQVPDEER